MMSEVRFQLRLKGKKVLVEFESKMEAEAIYGILCDFFDKLSLEVKKPSGIV